MSSPRSFPPFGYSPLSAAPRRGGPSMPNCCSASSAGRRGRLRVSSGGTGHGAWPLPARCWATPRRRGRLPGDPAGAGPQGGVDRQARSVASWLYKVAYRVALRSRDGARRAGAAGRPPRPGWSRRPRGLDPGGTAPGAGRGTGGVGGEVRAAGRACATWRASTNEEAAEELAARSARSRRGWRRPAGCSGAAGCAAGLTLAAGPWSRRGMFLGAAAGRARGLVAATVRAAARPRRGRL